MTRLTRPGFNAGLNTLLVGTVVSHSSSFALQLENMSSIASRGLCLSPIILGKGICDTCNY